MYLIITNKSSVVRSQSSIIEALIAGQRFYRISVVDCCSCSFVSVIPISFSPLYPCAEDPPPCRASLRLEGLLPLILTGGVAAVDALDSIPSPFSSAAAALASLIRFNFRFSVITPVDEIMSYQLSLLFW